MTRLDTPSKIDGSARYAGDIRLADMVYASVRQGPIGDTKLASFNREGAAEIVGLIDVIDSDEWLAAVGTNWWAANRALDAMSPIFETRGALPDSAEMDAALESGDGARRFIERGDAGDEAFDALRVTTQRYTAAPALHAPVETRTATAHFRDGKLELWMAAQAPVAAIRAAAGALDIPVGAVTHYQTLSGGSFGRDLDTVIAGQAARIAAHMKRPVQLVWSRAQETINGHVRPASSATLSAATDRRGQIAALRAVVAAPPAAREQARRTVLGETPLEAMRATASQHDAEAVQGFDVPYAIPALRVAHRPVVTGVPSGNWRSNAHSANAFYIETFINELAAAAKTEPLSFRMGMMTGQPRMARCLTGVAAMAGWDGGVDASGMGLACHTMRGAYIALIVEARRGGKGRAVRRISATVDVGRIVHPDIARQQVEGGIVFGLAMALGATSSYDGGLPTARRLRNLALPRLADVPPIQIEFVRSEEEPAGVEEIGVPAVAPALANALYSSTGARLRTLPLFT